MKELLVQTGAAAGPGRLALALLLQAAGRTLEALAARLAFVGQAAPAETVLEFHAEAGAPEGALYVNGQLVGHLPGVNRL